MKPLGTLVAWRAENNIERKIEKDYKSCRKQPTKYNSNVVYSILSYSIRIKQYKSSKRDPTNYKKEQNQMIVDKPRQTETSNTNGKSRLWVSQNSHAWSSD